MKNIFKFIGIGFLAILFQFNTLKAQETQTDSLENKSGYSIAAFTFETGVFFPRNEVFQELYNTKSNFNFNFGFSFGNSEWQYLPYMKYSYYNVEIDKDRTQTTIQEDRNGEKTDNATRKQFAIGVMHPINISKNHFLQTKYGIALNMFEETITDTKNELFGFVLSVGYLNRISKYVSCHIDFGYDYYRSDEGRTLKDLSGFILNAGISFNLGANAK